MILWLANLFFKNILQSEGQKNKNCCICINHTEKTEPRKLPRNLLHSKLTHFPPLGITSSKSIHEPP